MDKNKNLDPRAAASGGTSRRLPRTPGGAARVPGGSGGSGGAGVPVRASSPELAADNQSYPPADNGGSGRPYSLHEQRDRGTGQMRHAEGNNKGKDGGMTQAAGNQGRGTTLVHMSSGIQGRETTSGPVFGDGSEVRSGVDTRVSMTSGRQQAPGGAEAGAGDGGQRSDDPELDSRDQFYDGERTSSAGGQGSDTRQLDGDGSTMIDTGRSVQQSENTVVISLKIESPDHTPDTRGRYRDPQTEPSVHNTGKGTGEEVIESLSDPNRCTAQPARQAPAGDPQLEQTWTTPTPGTSGDRQREDQGQQQQPLRNPTSETGIRNPTSETGIRNPTSETGITQSASDDSTDEEYSGDPGDEDCKDVTRIPQAWNKLVFHVTSSSWSKPIIIDTTEEISPCLLQWIMEVDRRREHLSDRLRHYGIVRVSIYQTGVIAVKIENSDVLERKTDVQQWLLDAIKSQTAGLTVSGFDAKTQLGSLAMERLTKDPPKEIQFNYASVFCDAKQDKCFLVGEQADVDNVRKLLGIYLYQRSLPLDEKMRQILEKLDFKSKLHQADVTLEIDQVSKGIILGAKTEKQLSWAEEQVKTFLGNLVTKEVKMAGIIVKLLKKENAYLHVLSKLGKQKCRVYTGITRNGIEIISCDDATAVKAEQLIQSSFTAVPVEAHIPDRMKLLFSRESKYTDKWEIMACDGNLFLAYTTDLDADISDMISKSSIETMGFPCSFAMSSYLKTFGKGLLDNLEEQFKVKISLPHNGRWIHMQGRTFGIRKARAELAKGMSKSTLELNGAEFHHVQLDAVKETIDKAAKRHKACWNLKEVKRLSQQDSKVSQVSNAEYHTSWVDEKTSKRITVVTGNPAGMDVDLLIRPVNTSMFSEENSISLAGGEDMQADCIQFVSQSVQRPANLGEVFVSSATGRLSCKMVGHLVMLESVLIHGSQQLKANPELVDQAVQELLTTAMDLRLRSIAFPFGSSSYFPAWSIESVMATFLKQHADTCVREMFLIYDLRDVDALVQQAQRALQRQGCQLRVERHGSQVASIKPSKKKKGVEIDLCSGDIFDMEGDCVVILTNHSLDLSRGYLSRYLLKRSGDQLQQKLFSKYPEGITVGEIAFTEATNMRFKYIFLSDLPSWKERASMKNLKELMKMCMRQAEQLNCSSIVFPALGTGRPGYPYREVAAVMFDTVTDYSQDAVGMERVIIVVDQNKPDIKKVFYNEEMRRKKFGRLADCLAQGIPVLKGDIAAANENTTAVTVKVACCEHLKRLPTYAVQVFFKEQVDKRALRSFLKFSSKQPCSFHDQMHVDLESGSEQSLRNAIQHCVNACGKELLSCLAIYCTSFVKLPVAQQIEVMMEELASMQSSNRYLHTVFVGVEDETGFKNAEAHLVQKELSKSAWSTFKKKVGYGGPTVVWSEDKHGQLFDNMEVQLVAGQQADVEGFAAEFRDIAQRQTPGVANVYEETDAKSAASEDVIDSVFEIIRVEVNPGIVEFKQRQGDFDPWQKVVEKVFEIRIISGKKSRTCFHVEGSLSDISRFETYLNDKFPEHPDMDTHRRKSLIQPKIEKEHTLEDSTDGKEEVHIDISQMKYQLMHKVCQEEMQQISEVAEGIHWTNGQLIVTCSQKHKSSVETLKDSCLIRLKDTQEDEVVSLSNTEQSKAMEAVEEVQRGFQDVYCSFVKERKTILVTGCSTERIREAKHRIKVLLGRMRPHARHGHGQGQSMPSYGVRGPPDTGLSGSRPRTRSSSDTDSHTDSISDSNTFQTQEGLVVKVYEGDITKAWVDCIVCASNDAMSHHTGVAAAIAAAAGEGYTEDCRLNVQAFGKLKFGEVRQMSPGELKYKHIFQAASPVSSRETDPERKRNTLDVIAKTVQTVLMMVDGRCLMSVALPALSAGRGGFPPEICAQQYYRAITKFSQSTGRDHLKEIHFVDMNSDTVKVIKTTFAKYMSSETDNLQQPGDEVKYPPVQAGSYTGNNNERRENPNAYSANPSSANAGSLPMVHVGKGSGNKTSSSAEGEADPQESTFHFNGKRGDVVIRVAVGDVTAVSVGAVVCPEDEQCSGKGRIARGLAELQAVSSWRREELKNGKLSKTQVTATRVKGGSITCRVILHAVAPRWDSYYVQYNKQFEKDLQRTMYNILEKASDMKIESVAVPLLGVSVDRSRDTPLETCCRAAVYGTLDFFLNGTDSSVKEIQFLTTGPEVVVCYRAELQRQLLRMQRGVNQTREEEGMLVTSV